MNQLPVKPSYRDDWGRLSLAELKDQDGYSYLLQWLKKNGAPAPVASEQVNANTQGRIVELLFTNATDPAVFKALAVADVVDDPVDALADLYHAGVIPGSLMTRPEFTWSPAQAPAPLPAPPAGKPLAVGNLIPGTTDHYANAGTVVPNSGDRVTDDPRGVFVAQAYSIFGSSMAAYWVPVQVTQPVAPVQPAPAPAPAPVPVPAPAPAPVAGPSPLDQAAAWLQLLAQLTQMLKASGVIK